MNKITEYKVIPLVCGVPLVTTDIVCPTVHYVSHEALVVLDIFHIPIWCSDCSFGRHRATDKETKEHLKPATSLWWWCLEKIREFWVAQTFWKDPWISLKRPASKEGISRHYPRKRFQDSWKYSSGWTARCSWTYGSTWHVWPLTFNAGEDWWNSQAFNKFKRKVLKIKLLFKVITRD